VRSQNPHPPQRILLRTLLHSFVLLALAIPLAHAQGNYEIQVYGSDTVAPRTTMVELHSNYTAVGHLAMPGLAATNHAEHETIEITQGINHWSEVGFYIFTSEQSGLGNPWVGDHIRPRVRVPFSPDTWTWEIRPIVDKQIGRWYLAVNPALERTWHGPDVNLGLDFSPGATIGFDFTKKINGAIEYYADYGDLRHPYPLHKQQQQVFPCINLNVSPRWEINFGVGVGATAATDHWIVKGILGRRFDWPSKKVGPGHA